MDVAYARLDCPDCGAAYFVPFRPIVSVGGHNASPRVVHLYGDEPIPDGAIPDYVLEVITDHQRREHAA
jgi:hypothetical protein